MTDIRIGPLGPLAWVDVVLLVWFALTAVSVAYVAWDAWRNNPELTVMKWGWILVTLYLGPVALMLYVLSCKEPFPGTHERFIKPLWKQSLGSVIHCVAGDATGRTSHGSSPILRQARSLPTEAERWPDRKAAKPPQLPFHARLNGESARSGSVGWSG